MTASQIRWAASHDWFVRDLGNGAVLCRDDYHHPATGWVSATIIHNDFAKLRAWAGY